MDTEGIVGIWKRDIFEEIYRAHDAKMGEFFVMRIAEARKVIVDNNFLDKIRDVVVLHNKNGNNRGLEAFRTAVSLNLSGQEPVSPLETALDFDGDVYNSMMTIAISLPKDSAPELLGRVVDAANKYHDLKNYALHCASVIANELELSPLAFLDGLRDIIMQYDNLSDGVRDTGKTAVDVAGRVYIVHKSERICPDAKKFMEGIFNEVRKLYQRYKPIYSRMFVAPRYVPSLLNIARNDSVELFNFCSELAREAVDELGEAAAVSHMFPADADHEHVLRYVRGCYLGERDTRSAQRRRDRKIVVGRKASAAHQRTLKTKGPTL